MATRAVPAPLAIHPEGWLLLAEFGEPVGWSAPVPVQAEMFARGELKRVAFTQRDVDAQAVRRYRPGEAR